MADNVTSRWGRRVGTWGMWGAPFGFLVLIVEAFSEDHPARHSDAEMAGRFLGSIVGGMLLFALIPICALALSLSAGLLGIVWQLWLTALAQMAAAIRGDGRRRG